LFDMDMKSADVESLVYVQDLLGKKFR
jgi:hypothetical protein